MQGFAPKSFGKVNFVINSLIFCVNNAVGIPVFRYSYLASHERLFPRYRFLPLLVVFFSPSVSFRLHLNTKKAALLPPSVVISYDASLHGRNPAWEFWWLPQRGLSPNLCLRFQSSFLIVILIGSLLACNASQSAVICCSLAALTKIQPFECSGFVPLCMRIPLRPGTLPISGRFLWKRGENVTKTG